MLLLACVIFPAFGLVYSWTDTRGVTHYTNKEYEIPDSYRSKTKTLYPDQGDVAPAQPAAQGQQITPSSPPTKPEVPVRVRRRHRESSPSTE